MQKWELPPALQEESQACPHFSFSWFELCINEFLHKHWHRDLPDHVSAAAVINCIKEISLALDSYIHIDRMFNVWDCSKKSSLTLSKPCKCCPSINRWEVGRLRTKIGLQDKTNMKKLQHCITVRCRSTSSKIATSGAIRMLHSCAGNLDINITMHGRWKPF